MKDFRELKVWQKGVDFFYIARGSTNESLEGNFDKL